MLKLKNVLLTNISTIQMGIKMRSLVTLHFIGWLKVKPVYTH